MLIVIGLRLFIDVMIDMTYKTVNDILNSKLVNQIFMLRNDSSHSNEHFLVISNFKYREEELGKVYNIYTGISNIDFVFSIMDIVDNYESELEFESGGVLIVKAEESILKSIKNDCGNYFSYAFTNRIGVDYTIDRIRAAAKESEEDIIARSTGVIKAIEPLH